jgi:hypothetical protein
VDVIATGVENVPYYVEIVSIVVHEQYVHSAPFVLQNSRSFLLTSKSLPENPPSQSGGLRVGGRPDGGSLCSAL